MVPDFLTIAEAGALIAKRELSPVDLDDVDRRGLRDNAAGYGRARPRRSGECAAAR